ncbi:MAG TPA: UDP-N-acetylmuramoylalanyl-D-glutamyl-2,6-diaminopimelate--D-alanyl-D-alanine ligase [Methyloceanibacter sp.]|nr:UDP-N-acetylmuramoylalanyl-D-glutamyl-2,6-diaminopimelate--D-alanyl-D-alanine ligase [Methyloceanibacter sp.]
MPKFLWTVGEMVKSVHGKSALPSTTPVSGVSIDSRSLAPDEAFVALRGLNRDGHLFVEAALSQGASCAIVEQDFKAPRGEKRLIRASDTSQALNDLGIAGRARAKDAVVIAVTGSVGKTGTKEALKLALTPSGPVHVSLKSHNNHWGVPLSLANMRQDASFGVLEAGMNHAGELSELTRLIKPHIAIITTVAPVHLGLFRSIEAIADAKAEILEGLVPGGVAILNRNNPHYDRLRRHALQRKARVVSFGETSGADARSLSVELGPETSEVKADILGETVTYRIGAPGIHFVQNSLAVLAAVKLAEADLKAAARAFSGWHAQTGRGERVVIGGKGGRVAIIDESYNANPASMRAALATLGLTPRDEYKRRVAVLGDMLELGGLGPKLHRELAEVIDAADVDVVYACGEMMRGLYDALPAKRRGGYAKTSEQLVPLLTKGVGAGDVVMVKGSFGSRMVPLVEALHRHFQRPSPAAQV